MGKSSFKSQQPFAVDTAPDITLDKVQNQSNVSNSTNTQANTSIVKSVSAVVIVTVLVVVSYLVMTRVLHIVVPTPFSFARKKKGTTLTKNLFHEGVIEPVWNNLIWVVLKRFEGDYTNALTGQKVTLHFLMATERLTFRYGSELCYVDQVARHEDGFLELTCHCDEDSTLIEFKLLSNAAVSIVK